VKAGCKVSVKARYVVNVYREDISVHRRRLGQTGNGLGGDNPMKNATENTEERRGNSSARVALDESAGGSMHSTATTFR
jgi:hypothetical protein